MSLEELQDALETTEYILLFPRVSHEEAKRRERKPVAGPASQGAGVGKAVPATFWASHHVSRVLYPRHLGTVCGEFLREEEDRQMHVRPIMSPCPSGAPETPPGKTEVWWRPVPSRFLRFCTQAALPSTDSSPECLLAAPAEARVPEERVPW